jgi:hypothetical protein
VAPAVGAGASGAGVELGSGCGVTVGAGAMTIGPVTAGWFGETRVATWVAVADGAAATATAVAVAGVAVIGWERQPGATVSSSSMSHHGAETIRGGRRRVGAVGDRFIAGSITHPALRENKVLFYVSAGFTLLCGHSLRAT